MPKTKIVIWMNQPSYYQTVFFRELASRGHPLQVFYHTDLAPFRKDLGWQSMAPEAYDQRVLRGPMEALREACRHREAVHLVNGFWSIPSFMLASLYLLLTGVRVFFHAEHPDPAMTRGGLWYRLKCWWTQWLMMFAGGLFVIGRRAGRYYRRMGVPAGRIVPFMYFTRRPDEVAMLRPRHDPGVFTIAYVGQFVEWKRIEDLIRATAALRADQPDCRLLLLGAGPLAKHYLTLAGELGLGGAVELRGPLPPVEIWRSLVGADVLVLPSRFDGWGLTINEALQSGIPAICSDGCGAAEILMDNPGWGLVYPQGDVPALTDALQRVASSPRRFVPQTDAVEGRIGAKALTDLFVAIVLDMNLKQSVL